MFIAAGLSIIAVFISIRCPSNASKVPTSILWYIIGGAVYILGASFYIARVPERCSPGRFDLCGASHQIFHVAVLIGCGIHFWQNYVLFN
jgi:adiponectin receptor